MNIKDLEYLTAIAKSGSFSRAAQMCSVGQSTLSTQIKKLETSLGVTLFNRSKKEVRINKDAKAIFEKASLVLRLVDEIETEARNMQDPHAGTLRMGAFPTIASYLLPVYAKKISEKFKSITLILREEKSAILIEQLEKGLLDCAILAEPITQTSLRSVKLFQDDFFLAVHPEHHFAKRKRVRIDELAREKLLLLTEGHCLREQALSVCKRARISEENFQATSMSTLIEMVRLGTGITLIPNIAMQNEQDIVYIPIQKPTPSRSIALAWAKNSSKDSLFLELAATFGEVRAE